MVRTITLQHEDPVFESVLSLHILPVSVWVSFPGTPVSSHIPKNIQSRNRLVGYSKLPVRMNVSVDCCLSLHVSSAMI